MSNNLSTYVKEMRRQFGLTQVDLAAKSGVGLRFITRIGARERDAPSRQGEPSADAVWT